MPQWRDVDVNFRGSGNAFSDATQAAARAGQGFSDLARTLEEQKRYETELARQKVLDERATTLFNQQQEDRNQLLKDRAGRIEISQLLSQTVPHLLSKDTGYDGTVVAGAIDGTVGMMQGGTEGGAGIGKISTPRTMQVTTTGQREVALPTPNPQVDFTSKVRGAGQKLPEKSTMRQVVEGILPVSGVGNVMKAGYALMPDPAVSKLLETPGMYKIVPGSSVRELNKAGEEALKKGMIPGTIRNVSMKTDLNSIDFSNPVDAKRNPFSQTSKGTAYFRDTKSGHLVSEKDVTRALTGVDMKPTKVETVTGTKTVKIPGLENVLMSAYKAGGNPKQIQSVGNDIKAGYQSVLDMLPKDNTARREELRNIANELYADRGLDPKDYDIDKVVNGLLPKTEVSEAQKIAMNTTINALDKQLEQLNKNREYSLAERKFLADQYFNNARLVLSQQELAFQKQKARAEGTKIPEGYILDPRYAPEGYVSKDAYLAGLKKAARTPEEIRKEQLEIQKLEKELKSGFSLFSPSTW